MNLLETLARLNWWHIAGWTMLHYLWLGALVGVVAGVSGVLLRRAGANVRYATAVAWLCVLAVLPVGVAVWVGAKPQAADVGEVPLVEMAPETELMPSAPGSAGGNVEVTHEAATNLSMDGTTPAQPPLDLAPIAASNPRPTRKPGAPRGLMGGLEWEPSIEIAAVYLPWVWIVGAPITFLLLATGVVGAERLRRASDPIKSGPIADTCARLRASLGIRREVCVALCERIATPVLVGVVRPIILLPPAALMGWSPEEIEMVLLHELAHVRRWDNLVNLVQRLIEATLFYQPAVWLVSRWVRREREACCDAVVVGQTQQPHAYAELLVALAAQLPRSVLFHPAATSAMAAGPIRSRIHRVMGINDDPMLISGKSLGVVMAGLLLAATLAVLNLPTRGQAEESTTESTENTEARDKEDNDRRIRAEQNQSLSNLKELVFAMHKYESVRRRLPPVAAFDSAGKPLLSWRVLLLPYLDEQELYEQFRLDEPWDSEHNRKLIARMPKVFKNPQIDRAGFTNYLAVVGEDCVFDGTQKGIHFAEITDGTSKTIALVEADADRAVEWTKPADWQFEREHPRAGLGGLWKDEWLAAWCDAHAKPVLNSESAETVRMHMTRRGDEVFLVGGEPGYAEARMGMGSEFGGDMGYGRDGGGYGGEMAYGEYGRSGAPAGPALVDVPFVVGASRFEDGDRIEITDVRGTAGTFERGNVYWIRGTYTLVSRDRAQLSAFTTARNAAEGRSSIQRIQTTTVDRGSGEFTLWLPMTVSGWPHVSFYPDGGGNGFGGIYFGTGDSVLEKWWGEKDRTAEDRTTEGTEKTQAETKSPTAGLEESLEKKISFCVVLFNAPGRSRDLRDLYHQFSQEGRTIYLYGYTVDPDSPAGKRYRLTADPTCVVFKHGQETARLEGIESKEQLVEFVEGASEKEQPPAAEVQQQVDDWPIGVVFASPQEGEISRRAWQKLGLKLVPATDEELAKAGASQGVKVVAGIPRESVPGEPETLILVGLNDTPLNEFSDVATALDELDQEPQPILKCVLASNWSVVTFQKVLGADLSKLRRMTIGDPEGVILRRENTDLQKAKEELEKKLAEVQTDFLKAERQMSESTDSNTDKKSALLTKEFQIRAGMLQEQLQAVNESLSAKMEAVPNAKQLDESRGANAEQPFKSFTGSSPENAARKFPTLEEQKLADLSWERLALELEPIGDEGLKRVQELGYQGGLRIAGSRSIGVGPFRESKFLDDDILVGLHVWPTTSLQDVATILNRDDLAELSPLKYYVIRPIKTRRGAHTETKDEVVTGRISVETNAQEEADSGPKSSQTQDRSRGVEGTATPIPNGSMKTSTADAPTDEQLDRMLADDPTMQLMNMELMLLQQQLNAEYSNTNTGQSKESYRLKDVIKDQLEKIAAHRTSVREKLSSELRYDGKTFDEWRTAWQTELSLDKRLEVVKALAAFGASGRGKDAAEAILDVANQLDWSYIQQSAKGRLQQACIDAFTTGEVTDGYRIPSEAWLPLVIPIVEKSEDTFTFASYLPYQLPVGDKNLIPRLVELANEPATRNWALQALKAVDPKLEDERVLAWFREAMQQPNLSAADEQLLIGYLSYSKNPYGGGENGVGLRFVPELESFLFDSDERTRRTARKAIASIQPADARELVKRLNARLDDVSGNDRTEVIRALSAIGKQALPAESRLEQMAHSESDPNRYVAAVALERIRDNESHSYLNLGIDIGTTPFEPHRRKLEAEQRELFPDGIYPPRDPMLGGGGGFF